MADATLAEFRNRVLQKLFVLQSGETADAADAVLVEGVIASVNEKLRDLEIAYWDDSACPQAVLEDLSVYVACHCAGDFMELVEADKFKDSNETKSLKALREITATRKKIVDPTRATYF